MPPDAAVMAPFSTIKQARGMFWKCDLPHATFRDVAFFMDAFKEAISMSNATIVKLDHHLYEPHGLTIIAILEDSHAVLHTWPEASFVMVEILTCGDRAKPAKGIAHLASRFKPKHHDVTEHLARVG